MSDVLVKVDNVSKRFCRSLKRSLWYGMQDLGSEIGGRRHGGGNGLPQSSADVELRPDEFWAVKDVSFELRRGECLGLIGRNGAGKTTLLRMLNGLIKPDTGRIEMNGHVGALIALGAGFNPILSGLENIYTSAAVMGVSAREASKQIDSIVEFAELGDFIHAPLQSYSSGMQVRLGFAVATIFKPSILILDEVLAVGDLSFRKKCYERLGSLKRSCATILVSHDPSAVAQLCQNGIYLENGASKLGIQDVDTCLDSYNSTNGDNQAGTRTLALDRSLVTNHSLHFYSNLTYNEKLSAELIISCNKARQSTIRTFIRDQSHNVLGQWYMKNCRLNSGVNKIQFDWEKCLLSTGRYIIDVNLYGDDGISTILSIVSACFSVEQPANFSFLGRPTIFLGEPTLS